MFLPLTGGVTKVQAISLFLLGNKIEWHITMQFISHGVSYVFSLFLAVFSRFSVITSAIFKVSWAHKQKTPAYMYMQLVYVKTFKISMMERKLFFWLFILSSSRINTLCLQTWVNCFKLIPSLSLKLTAHALYKLAFAWKHQENRLRVFLGNNWLFKVFREKINAEEKNSELMFANLYM